MQSEELKTELKELAEILNQFKSEAVQLKVLDMLGSRLSSPGAAPTTRKPKRSKERQRTEARAEAGEQIARRNARPASPRAGGHGAHSIILRLLEEGFFDKAQTISKITKHASERLGHHLKANECSPTLLRLLRSGKLTRSKNNDGQYEYSKA